MLSRRLAERGLDVSGAALDAAVPAAWSAYNHAIRAGQGGHPWKVLMSTLLGESGVPAEAMEPTVSWPWDQQPSANLWRRPIAGMIDIVRDLRHQGVPVGVI